MHPGQWGRGGEMAIDGVLLWPCHLSLPLAKLVAASAHYGAVHARGASCEHETPGARSRCSGATRIMNSIENIERHCSDKTP